MLFDEDRWIEIVDGEIVEQDRMAAGNLHLIIIDNLYDVLKPFVKANKLGMVHTDGFTFILEEREGMVNRTRVPDLCFVRKSSIPEDYDRVRPFPGAPTLAIEVTSPGQSIDSMSARVRDYLEFGSEEVWVIQAIAQEVHRYLKGDSNIVHVYHYNDIIIAEGLFPGLEIPVNQLFEPDTD
jgi:Uma2 family endonuclease